VCAPAGVVFGAVVAFSALFPLRAADPAPRGVPATCRLPEGVRGIWDKQGQYVHAYLAHPVVIGGVTVRGSVDFYPDGSLKIVSIDDPQSIGGIMVRGYTEFYPSGALQQSTVASATNVAGIEIAQRFTLHENGRIKEAFLARDQVIGGAALPAESRVGLDANGRLTWATIAGRAEVQGLRLTGHVSFHSSGTIRSANLLHGQQVRGIGAAGCATFYPSGSPKGVELDQEQEIAGIRGWGHASFHESGKLQSVQKLHPAQSVDGILWPAGTSLVWFESGRVKEAWCPSPVTLGGMVGVGYVSFHESGGVKTIHSLAEKAALPGGSYEKGARVDFGPDGTVGAKAERRP
jgi:hypothetical protein